MMRPTRGARQRTRSKGDGDIGLDNIPASYPCVLEGSALTKDSRPYRESETDESMKIDCIQTQAANGCPWARDAPKQGQAVGMFGTDCWYRGKVGMWMINQLTEAGYSPPEASFYGDDESEPNLRPEDCAILHKWMVQHGEAWAELARVNAGRGDWGEFEDSLHLYTYATWWIGWVGRKAGGANAWW